MVEFRPFKPPTHINHNLRDLKTKPAIFWEKQGERNAVALLRYAYKNVPAYKKLLEKAKISINKIKKIEDFKKTLIIDKNSYCKKNRYRDLFPNRDLSKITTFSATSGSTGEPFYFPRSELQDSQYEYAAEVFLVNQWEIDKKSTLGIIGFGLGIWIGGLFTYKAFNKLAQKGYNLSLVPTGPNKELFLKSLKKFGHMFDQVILMGYPPFIKDIIDEAEDYKIDWNSYSLRILTAAEGFSEEFRRYITEKTLIKNPINDVINIYGTVELGTMAHETALTNLIRKIACQSPDVFQKIFPKANRVPTLAQYHPDIVYFEEIDGDIVGSGTGSLMPLVRYKFSDKGGVVSFDKMTSNLKENGIDILKEARKAKIHKTILKLPFIYVFERSDLATSLFGILIYPEYIKNALQRRLFSKYLTGKFTMITKENKCHDQFLEINVELKKNKQGNKRLIKAIGERVIESLMEWSTEYNYLYKNSPSSYQKKLAPKIVLWPYEHCSYFTPGIKQKWVKNK